MDGRTIRDMAAAVAAAAGILLLVDLSLAWYSVKVTSVGVVHVTATSSGWAGIGIVAGLVTIAMLVYMIRPVRNAGSIDAVQAVVTAGLGVAALCFTTVAALTGSASVSVPDTAIEAGSKLWPAYIGVGLGGVVAVGTLTALMEVLRGVTAPSSAINPTP